MIRSPRTIRVGMPAARASEANSVANSLHLPLRHARTSGPVSVSAMVGDLDVLRDPGGQRLDRLQRVGLAPGHLARDGDDLRVVRLDETRLAQVRRRTPAPRSAAAPATSDGLGASIRTTARYGPPHRDRSTTCWRSSSRRNRSKPMSFHRSSTVNDSSRSGEPISLPRGNISASRPSILR